MYKSPHCICRLVLAVGLLFASGSQNPIHADEPAAWAAANIASLLDLYRHFHAHPELSFAEEKTSQRLAEEFRKLGAEAHQRIGGFGVVGILRNGEGPTLMLRADMDALPVVEDTGLDFASRVTTKDAKGRIVGVMHACGHDLHMTNLIGVARFLANHREVWRGTLLLVGQPAEERGAGAAAMLEDGLFRKFPRPDFALALHVDAALEAGKVGIRGGYTLANVDSVDITLHGRGGHGAYPHTTVDPVVIAARLIMDLQTIVAREIAPTDPAVITVGSIHGGTKHNVIGNVCRLQLTVRSYGDEVRQHLIDAIRRKAHAAATSAKAREPEIEVSEGTPALRNDEALAQQLAEVFREVLGAEQVGEAELSMGGEDFSRYGLAGVPILMFRLGVVDKERLDRFRAEAVSPPSLHSPAFYPDADQALQTGVTAMSAAALALLSNP